MTDTEANLHKMLIAEQCKVAQLLAACEAALADSVDQWGEGWSLDSPAGMLHEQLRAAIAAAKGNCTEVQDTSTNLHPKPASVQLVEGEGNP